MLISTSSISTTSLSLQAYLGRLDKNHRLNLLRFFSVEILKTHPKAGRKVPEIKDSSIRELIIGFYRIIYQIQGKTKINIITVHHSKKLVRSKLFKK